MSACLDSWALLAWLDGDEPAAGRVDELLAHRRGRSRDRPVMSWINAIEVSYRVERDHGRSESDRILAEMRARLRLEVPSPERCVQVARVKARQPMALADCFAVATATGHGLPLLTGDPEIVERADILDCEVVDLRGPRA